MYGVHLQHAKGGGASSKVEFSATSSAVPIVAIMCGAKMGNRRSGQLLQKRVHFASDLPFVQLENVVICVRQPYDMRRWQTRLKCICFVVDAISSAYALGLAARSLNALLKSWSIVDC